jgi:8-hydroxy-5-deazaflavin:NADPH oxidoreductase
MDVLKVAAQAAGLVIGVLGGTGDEGRGLARRLAIAGNRVIIGSRDAKRAEAAAAALAADPALTPLPADPAAATLAAGAAAPPLVTGAANEDAARNADLVIAAVPWAGHRDTLSGLAEVLDGKILVDCVNPIGFDSRGAYPLPVPEGSAAEQAAAVLPGSRVVGAFHHVSADLLLDPTVAELDLDVLVLGDDREATDLVQALATRLPGVRGIYAGRLRNCGQVEALTANLISVNRRYKGHAGLRITEIEGS